MKTAIQELKESLQSINQRYQLKGDANWLMNEVLDLVENSLEKEKEQITPLINALKKIRDWDDEMHSEWDDCGEFAIFTLKTYNQNK
jgi:uncharacterized coiled-coil DUF342 family protein